MKREAAGWFVAGVMLVCIMGAMQQGERSEVGRYQLVEGHFQIRAADGATVDGVTVWRIDTSTGETVEYVCSPGLKSIGWMLVKNVGQ